MQEKKIPLLQAAIMEKEPQLLPNKTILQMISTKLLTRSLVRSIHLLC